MKGMEMKNAELEAIELIKEWKHNTKPLEILIAKALQRAREEHVMIDMYGKMLTADYNDGLVRAAEIADDEPVPSETESPFDKKTTKAVQAGIIATKKSIAEAIRGEVNNV